MFFMILWLRCAHVGCYTDLCCMLTAYICLSQFLYCSLMPYFGHYDWLQFAPTYHEYILYSDGNEVEPQRYRARTFVHTGQELESIPKLKNPYLADKLGNSLYSADAPSEISSSATVNMDSRGKLSVGDPSLQEAGLSHPNDPSLMEPTVAGHQIVDVELPPGTVRPAQ